jgi:hypothetical protein
MHVQTIKALTAEGRNERGVNVDDSFGIGAGKPLAEDGHKAGEHDEVDLVLG